MTETAEHYMLEALAAWYIHPAVANAEPRGMPIWVGERDEAERLAERGLIVIHKDPAPGSAWFIRYPGTDTGESSLA